MALMAGAAKVMKAVQLPGESLTQIKAQWDSLTDSDKQDLVAWLEAEQGSAAA